MWMQMYYHVIEEGYNEEHGYVAASHGCYDTEEEAWEVAGRLSAKIPDCSFWVYQSFSNKEPEFITI